MKTRLPVRVLALAAVLAIQPLTVLATPAPGGDVRGHTNDDQSPHVSITAPAPRWQTELRSTPLEPEGYVGLVESKPVLDSQGHVLIAGRTQRNGHNSYNLVALHAATGAVAWETPDIDPDCEPLATSDGMVYVVAVGNGASDPGNGTSNSHDIVVELAAADGELTGRFWEPATSNTTPQGTEPGIFGCDVAIHEGPDDIILFRAGVGTVFAVNTARTAPALSRAWILPNAEGQVKVGPVLSPDREFVYVVRDLSGAWTLEVRAARTGAVLDSATLEPRDSTRTPELIGVEGGVIARWTNSYPDTIHVRFDHDDTGGALAETWRTIFSEDASVDTSGLQTQVSTLTAASDDLLFLQESSLANSSRDRVIAVDLADGAVVWATEMTWNTIEHDLVVDAAGNVIVARSPYSVGWLTSLDPNGVRRWRTPHHRDFYDTGELYPTNEAIGAIGPDGTIYLVGQGPESALSITAIGNGTRRFEGATAAEPVEIAISLCQFLFPDDAGRTVILARRDVFADALAGATLASDHSCILYTEGGEDGTLDSRTKAEIDRVLEPGSKVYVLGGPKAVSDATAAALAPDYDVQRIRGATRVETAVEIAKLVRTLHPDFTQASLAFADNWPDAVTGGAHAAAAGIPILLTYKDSLHPATAAALEEFGVTTTNVLGGPGVISDAAMNAAPGARRVRGTNRMGTAAEVADVLWDELITAREAGEIAYLVAELEVEVAWAIALASSPLAVRLGAPQIGVRQANYPTETKDFLQGRGLGSPAGLYVLGDASVIPDAIVEQVKVDAKQ